MTDWIAFNLYVVGAASFIACIWLYGKLAHEPDEPGPKMHQHSIRYLAERERRLRKCGR